MLKFFEMNTVYTEQLQRVLDNTTSYIGEHKPYKKSKLSSKQLKSRKKSKLAKIARRNNKK